MPKITKVETQKREGRFNIYIEGKFVVGLGEDLLVQEGLKVGKEITSAEVQDLVYKSKVEKLFDKALSLLGHRPRSKQEIRDGLWKKVRKLKVQKDLRADLIERTLDELEGKGYLDDKEFAEWWVKERIRSRPRGKLLLRSELYKKGVERRVAERVLEKYTREDELSWAKRLLERKASRYQKLGPERRLEKISAYLHRRGFSWDVINDVFDVVHKFLLNDDTRV